MAGEGREGSYRRPSGAPASGRRPAGGDPSGGNRDRPRESAHVDRGRNQSRDRDKDRDRDRDPEVDRDRDRSKRDRDKERVRDQERRAGPSWGSGSSSREREVEDDGSRLRERRITPPGGRETDGNGREEGRHSKRVTPPRPPRRAVEDREVVSPQGMGYGSRGNNREQHTTPPGSGGKVSRRSASSDQLTDRESPRMLPPPPPLPDGFARGPSFTEGETRMAAEGREEGEVEPGEMQTSSAERSSPVRAHPATSAAPSGTSSEDEPADRKRKFSPIRWDPLKGKDGKEKAQAPPRAGGAPTFRPADRGGSRDVSPRLPPPPPGRPPGELSQGVSRPPLRGNRTRTPRSRPANGTAGTPPERLREDRSPVSEPRALSSHQPKAEQEPAPQTSMEGREDRRVDYMETDAGRTSEPLDEPMEDAGPGRRLESSESEEENSEETDEGEEEEQIGRQPPAATVARSRWADDVQANEGSGGDGPQGSGSPEAGEYVPGGSGRQENGDGSGGSAEGGSGEQPDGGRGSRDDAEYERELNRRELEALEGSEEEDSEEQRPETDSEEEEERERSRMGRIQRSGPGNRMIDMLQGCRSVDEFERMNRIDEGTYGVVYRARDKKTGEIVALKKVKMDKEREGFPLTSLREINILLSFHHPSIVDVKEVVVGSNLDSIFMVMEYMEHDLKSLMEAMKQPFSQSEVKCLMVQLLEGTKYLHDNWVLHRDLKTSNLLLNNRGELKICDFGLARQYGSPLKAYTHMVVTLWYRAPELLLGMKQYSVAVDLWSLGCIMAELLAKEPLFTGKSELDQIDKIFKLLGTPNERIWPDFPNLPSVKKCNFLRQPYNKLRDKFPATSFGGQPALSEAGFDLLNRLLTYDPKKRISAEEALKHEWFTEVPLPKAQELMPTFPARHEHDRRLRRLQKSPDPLAERKGQHVELGAGGLFG